MSDWPKGNYAATTKAATVYEKNQKLLLGIAFDVGGTEMKKSIVLAEADGSLNTRNIERMRDVFGWDGIDPYWFVEAAANGLPCLVEVEMKPGYKDPTKSYPEINWINKAGGGSSMPESADRKSVLAKFGSKFRAIAGPQTVTAKPATASAAPAKPATPPAAPKAPAPRKAPPAPTVKHATLEECWELAQKVYQSLDQDALAEKWWKIIDSTGMDQTTMTPEGWDSVKKILDTVAQAPDEDLPF